MRLEQRAFGGDRKGIQRAQLERDRAGALAQAQGQAFEKGLSNFLASQQASAGLGGLGREFGGLGGAQAGLGFDTQRAGIADISTLLDFANLQQQQQQKGFDVDYANQLAQYQQPFTELGFLGSAFGYAPSIPSLYCRWRWFSISITTNYWLWFIRVREHLVD